jgi:TetR/AcrR family transcriptional repressor of nem operon
MEWFLEFTYRSVYNSRRTRPVKGFLPIGMDMPRPPGRPRSFDPDVVLDAAIATFLARGYDGASLDDLTAAMGIARPSLYAAFGDKQRLFLAAIERAVATTGAGQLAAFDAAPDLAGAVRAYLARIIADTGGAAAPGCLVASVAGDMAACDAAVRARLQTLFAEAETRLAARFRAAGRADPLAAARLLLAIAHGIILRARAGADRRTLTGMAHAAEALLAG